MGWRPMGLAGGESHRRSAAVALGFALLESTLMLLFAASLSLDTLLAAAYAVLRGGSSVLFWLAVGRGWTRRLRDPGLTLPRFATEWTLQLTFTVLVPRLTVIFMIALLVSYNHAMLLFNRRQFSVAWLLLGLAVTGALCVVHVSFEHPGTRGVDVFLLWLFFVLCLGRLTVAGRRHCRIREELHARSRSLQAGAQRLREASQRERLAERERIAHDLHAGLLQELRALRQRFQAAQDGIPAAHPAREALAAAVVQADRVIDESRERLLDLRRASIPATGLPAALEELGATLSQGQPVRFRLVTRGTLAPLQDGVADEIYRIAREAMSNALRHAGGTVVELALAFDTDALRLQVADNGQGMSQELLLHGRPGHWGLKFMRKRASGLGGRLDLRSLPGSGTRLRLRLPAERAYRPVCAAPPRRTLLLTWQALRGDRGRAARVIGR